MIGDRLDYYRCPACHGSLTVESDGFYCADCERRYPENDRFVDFILEDDQPKANFLTRSFFELIAPLYEEFHFPLFHRIGTLPHFNSPEDHAEKIVEHTTTQQGTVLDVACGTGLLTRKLAEVNKRVFGLDRSRNMVKEAINRAPGALVDRLDYSRGDAYRLPFADGTFHAVTCTGAFYLLPELDPALREMRRVLKPDCYLAGMTIVNEGILANDIARFLWDSALKWQTIEVHEIEPFKRTVLEAGFKKFTYDRFGCIILFSAKKS